LEKRLVLISRAFLLLLVIGLLFFTAKNANVGYKLTDKPASKTPHPVPKVTVGSVLSNNP
jgi:hypothetical protein